MSFLILRKDEFDAFGCEKNSLFFLNKYKHLGNLI